MKQETLFFPSGRTVDRCRQDAKALVKSSKASNSPIQLHAALDRVASKNGINLPWAKAIQKLNVGKRKKAKVAQKHLLGHALNLLINEGRIDMNSTDGGEPDFLECQLLGKPTIINWAYVGYGEIRMSVWWNFNKTKHPQHLEGGFKDKIIVDHLPRHEQLNYIGNKKGVFSNGNTVEKYVTDTPLARKATYINFVGVCCSTWVERKDGKYLQTGGGKHIVGSYIRLRDREALCSIPDCKPLGFELSGPLRM
jgi:hypothetical protein